MKVYVVLQGYEYESQWARRVFFSKERAQEYASALSAAMGGLPFEVSESDSEEIPDDFSLFAKRFFLYELRSRSGEEPESFFYQGGKYSKVFNNLDDKTLKPEQKEIALYEERAGERFFFLWCAEKLAEETAYIRANALKAEIEALKAKGLGEAEINAHLAETYAVKT